MIDWYQFDPICPQIREPVVANFWDTGAMDMATSNSHNTQVSHGRYSSYHAAWMACLWYTVVALFPKEIMDELITNSWKPNWLWTSSTVWTSGNWLWTLINSWKLIWTSGNCLRLTWSKCTRACGSKGIGVGPGTPEGLVGSAQDIAHLMATP